MITRDECATVGFPQAERAYTPTSDQTYRVSQVCRILNLDRRTVYKYIDAGLLDADAARRHGAVTRIKVVSVDRFLDGQ